MKPDGKTTLETLPSEKLKTVEVWTEKIDRNRHKISAKVTIPHSSEQVWQVLTDYEALANFIPHLVKSQRILHPESGIRVEQVGSKCPLHFCFSARVVLDLIEHFPHTIQFEMVEGDFKSFSGEWNLFDRENIDRKLTELHYSLQVIPKIPMPVALLEKQLYEDMPVNLLAISQRVSETFGQI
jgi:ribosome-associated toxin RatA of RatAB toxin-antitoxin module